MILGGLPTSGWTDVALIVPYVLIGGGIIVAHRRVLDVMSVGDDEAAASSA